jgi:acetylornithine deacetylase
MTDHAAAVADLARDLVRIDSRSPLSNHPVAERIEAELAGFEVERLDMPTYAAVAGTLLAASLLAGLLPARRAMRIDPVTALRQD